MKKIVIIGNGSCNSMAMSSIKNNKELEIVLLNNFNTNKFTEEPVIISNHYLRLYETAYNKDFKVYDKPKSKFHK